MRHPGTLLILAAFSFCACGAPEENSASQPPETSVVPEETVWIADDFQAAQDRASAEGKRIFIDFYADWCPPCRTLSEEYFPRPEYREFLAGVVPLKVNVDLVPDLAEQFSVSSIPTLVLTDAQGREIHRVVGVTGPPETFIEVLRGMAAE